MITIQKQLQEIDAYIQTQIDEIKRLISAFMKERRDGIDLNLNKFDELLIGNIGEVIMNLKPLSGYIKQHSMILRAFDESVTLFYKALNEMTDPHTEKQMKLLQKRTTKLRLLLEDIDNLKDKEFNEGFFEKDCFQDKWFANKPYKDCCTEEECE